MLNYQPGDRVAILDLFTSRITWGTVARVSPTGKRVWVTLDASHIIKDIAYNWQPSHEWHANEWHGILTVSPYSDRDADL